MVTLCSFHNPVEAALAKSRLDDRNIFCSLADENVNRLGGAPFAMPIRLLVAEEQAEEAKRILAEEEHPLPADFSSEPVREAPSDPTQELRDELARLQRANHWIGLGIVLLLSLTIYLLWELPSRTSSPWDPVTKAMRSYDYPTALQLALPLVARTPNDYYGHEYLGGIYAKLGDLEEAEKEYSRAIALAPPQSLQAKLEAIQRRLKADQANP
ncbi:MAG: DUF2007 domain-containing protein [Verrucomicrobiota bacterium]|nr:DUF2007 domain-containing protein [Verrucomicrobiota bacterium]